MSEKNSSSGNTALAVVAVALIAAITALLYKYFVELKKKDEFITEEGKEILENETKRQKLNKAIDQYKENGNWDGLSEV
jgi:hypothetical protein